MFACYEEILKGYNRSSLGQSSVLYFRSSSLNWATPSVLLAIGDHDADGLPTVQEKVYPSENIIGLSHHPLFLFSFRLPLFRITSLVSEPSKTHLRQMNVITS